MRTRNLNKKGKLLELSPIGSGLIEDTTTGARYGFHVSMLRRSILACDAPGLDGHEVNFELAPNGSIMGVTESGVTENFSSHP